ncbi:MAG: Na+/H+ antiporter subunit E [Deltaproteobacteria bacterium]|nr:Na+/H+ antiporter subunit E [Deltaproteobacteria bacterium]
MKRRLRHHLIIFGGLFTFWVILSGMLDATHLIMGAICAAGVTLLSARHLRSADGIGGPGFYLTFIRWHHVALYLPWLFVEIIKANLYVLKLVLGPRAGWDPQITNVGPDLKSELAQVVLANSITLTPGTVTIDVVDERFIVHSIDVPVALDIESGTMGRRVKAAFGREIGKEAAAAIARLEAEAPPRRRKEDR